VKTAKTARPNAKVINVARISIVEPSTHLKVNILNIPRYPLSDSFAEMIGHVPFAVGGNASVRERAASKIGSFTMRCFKIRIAARPAMGGPFAPATSIVAGTNCTTITPKP
jgi:hypothetical protein